MSKKIAFLLAFGCYIALTSVVSANTLNFEDLYYHVSQGDTEGPITNYSGFTFGNAGYTTIDATPLVGIIGKVAICNMYYNQLSMSDTNIFSFDNAIITALEENQTTVLISGWLGSSKLFSKSFDISLTSPTLITANWTGINQLIFGDGDGQRFLIDDMNFNGAPVPEPATALLFGAGLTCLTAVGRKKMIKHQA